MSSQIKFELVPMKLLELLNALGSIDPNLTFKRGFKGAFRHPHVKRALALHKERDVPVFHMFKVLKTIQGAVLDPSVPVHKEKKLFVGDETACFLVNDSDSVGYPVTQDWFVDEVEFSILNEEYLIARSLLDHLSEWVRRTELYGTNKKIEDDMIVLSAPAPDLHSTARYKINWGTMKLINGWVTGQYKKG